MTLRTAVGAVTIQTLYGQDPLDRHWGCPLREHWGLTPHQRLSPALAERLCFTVTATGSYAEAAAVAAKWGCTVEESVLHALVQRVGGRAEQRQQKRLAEVPEEADPKRAAADPLVLMLDGWQVRQRGAGWGAPSEETNAPRVEWHELKTAVIYRHDQAAQTAGGRGLLADKAVVSWQGEPLEFGRRVHWQAQRGGLGRARTVLAVADGAPWIWNVVGDRWSRATQVLDFYHASQHLWALGQAVCGEEKAAAWVAPRRERLREGEAAAVVEEIRALRVPKGERGEVVRREANYFAQQAQRMDYETVASRGWPIGSGAVESACRQKQCRFKRAGQFWTPRGLRHLCAVDEARRNGSWDELWPHAHRGQ
ncbi:MAG: hypothetical protein HY682_07985 [Chloroflexi bacterium]|nr:hypothetical protein [Chloroflexota bacterium]